MKEAEKDHLTKVSGLGCVVCRNEGLGISAAEIHHIRDGQGMSQRASHFETIPLCPIHHRTGGHGHAGFHQSPKEFKKRYGTERELLFQVNELLNQTEFSF